MVHLRNGLILGAALLGALVFASCFDPVAGTPDPSTESGLASIEVRVDGTVQPLSPTFSSDVRAYELSVSDTTAEVEISAQANDAGATVSGDLGTRPVVSGDNVFTVTMTSSGGSSSTDYSITVRKLQVRYVDVTSGSDANSGSRSNPYETIQFAIDDAVANGADEVHVAEGLYEQGQIVVEGGLAVRGGFDPGDWSRDVTANRTVVQNTLGTVFRFDGDGEIEGLEVRTFGDGEAPDASFSAIVIPDSSAVSATITDVTIHVASSNSNHFGIRVFNNASGTLTIQDSTIFAGGTGQVGRVGGIRTEAAPSHLIHMKRTEIVLLGVSEDSSWGVEMRSGDIVIEDSVIRTDFSNFPFGVDGLVVGVASQVDAADVTIDSTRFDLFVGAGSNSQSWGVRQGTGTLTMRNSIVSIASDDLDDAVTAVELQSGAAASTLYNNTIVVKGKSPTKPTLGIDIYTPASGASISNNIVIALNFDSSGATQAIQTTTSPVVTTNMFYSAGEPTPLFGGVGGNVEYTGVVSDLFYDFAFADSDDSDNDQTNDFKLVPAAPATVRSGGTELSSEGLTRDFDGVLRTVPYSMGAFELDP